MASENGLKSISIPSLSTGAFCYPIRLAAPIALKAIVDFLKTEAHKLNEVRMVLYTREDEKSYDIYVRALEMILFEKTTGSLPK